MTTYLDPKPYVLYIDGQSSVRLPPVDQNPREPYWNPLGEYIERRFKPRHGYSQNREDYS